MVMSRSMQRKIQLMQTNSLLTNEGLMLIIPFSHV